MKRQKKKESVKKGTGKKQTGNRQDAIVPGQTGENYPMEDRALKEAARFMGEELLPLLGVEGTVRRASPTEAVFLEVGDFLADFNYEMTDGTWKHLEFESDSLSVEDLRRFRAYEAVVSYKYGVDVCTYVVCTAKTKVIKSCLVQGKNTYRVEVLRMKDYNADEIIRKVEEKQKAGERPGREELLKVLLTSLMDGEMSQELRVKRSLGILQREQEHVEKGQMVPMQSVLYALAMKVLTKDEIKKVKEMMTMTLLGQMLMEDGIEKGIAKGIEKGEFKAIQELIRDGLLSMETAAARKHMTVEEFKEKLKELNLS